MADKNFRPICLLNSCKSKNEFSERQYGFRRGKSTIQAVENVINIVRENQTDRWATLITVDVKNAFNSASWDIILRKLRRMGIPKYLLSTIDNYLEERSIQIDKGTDMEISAGVPQGSILGPTLWNVLYNDLLEEVMPKGVHTIAYADDLALVVTAKDKSQLKWKADEALIQVNRWMEENELELAPHKTEAVILRGRKEREIISFRCNGLDIQPKDSIEYLGITMGQSCQFGDHIKKSVIKAEEKAAQIMRLTSNLRGPGSRKREMLYNVVQSILVYGAPIWHGTAKKSVYKDKLTKNPKKDANQSSQCIPNCIYEGITELIIEERQILYHREDGSTEAAKREERENTIQKWQDIWNQTEDVAQWTKQLIPQVDDWLKCRHRKTDYYLSQILTGHGSFTAYTNRIGKTDSDACRYCSGIDTTAHTLFECPRWQIERNRVNAVIGSDLSTENIVRFMLQDEKDWQTIYIYIRNVMKTKEVEERQEAARIRNP
ncbi:hypothetical protein NQ315_012819 [Exocentrus adspersus]|uniref:Reverse transcriptase domain-containing protein n=1 Tax=Exocentrus adspersus TaxID=1586481 RepID=A0AAV8V928_9CUCU|nr:hypothetical protein NQ315_012819 [Exocentrus adspersus]